MKLTYYYLYFYNDYIEIDFYIFKLSINVKNIALISNSQKSF